MLTRQPRVALVSMPWGPVHEPPLGLAILKAVLRQRGIECRVFHLQLELLEYLRYETYKGAAEIFGLNDFLFTAGFETDLAPEQFDMLLDMTYHGLYKWPGFEDYASLAHHLLRVRTEAVPRFLADCLEAVGEYQPTMVGFTCMYDQTIASVALAKLLRTRLPDALTVFGGYALEGEVGEQILESFEFVDVIARGDGEACVEGLALASVGKAPLGAIDNVTFRDSGGGLKRTRTVRIPLAASPVPDFDDFFADVERLHRTRDIQILVNHLPFETSRGCWWGQLHHCTFCGIDDETMKYRQRDPDEALRCLDELHARYGVSHFQVVDYIMPHEYYGRFLDRLAAEKRPYTLRYELKANLNEKRVARLARAGVLEVQPGIESFSSEVLALMNKGTTAIQNAQTLKLCLKHGIETGYNVLVGFPGERAEDYRQMAQTIPKLYHLYPPGTQIRVMVTRFAPLEQRLRSDGGVRHEEAYDVIFSPELQERMGFDLDRYCYYFHYPYETEREVSFWHYVIQTQCAHWQDLWRSALSVGRVEECNGEPRLLFRVDGQGIEFEDTRFDPRAQKRRFGQLHRAIHLEAGDAITTEARIFRGLANRYDLPAIREALAELEEERLILREGDKLLTLAIAEADVGAVKRQQRRFDMAVSSTPGSRSSGGQDRPRKRKVGMGTQETQPCSPERESSSRPPGSASGSGTSRPTR